MSFDQSIRDIWLSSPLPPPTNVLAWMNGLDLIVVDDSTTIIKLMDLSGKSYVTSRSKCQQDNGQYICESANILPCGTDDERDRFVRSTIIPLIR